MTAWFTAAEVRAAYPNVMAARDGRKSGKAVKDRYCIGGALARYLSPKTVFEGFPTMEDLEQILASANRDASHGECKVAAEEITKHNEARDFECGWAALDRFLKLGPMQ